MKSIVDHLSFYSLHHRNIWNKLLHFIGIPSLMFSILLPMSWVRIPIYSLEISLAVVFVCSVLLYYFLLDASLSVGAVVLYSLLVFDAEYIATRWSLENALTLLVITFISGGVVQIIGHAIEGKRPAFVGNLLQVFIAPIFLVAEIFFLFNLRKDLQEKVTMSGR